VKPTAVLVSYVLNSSIMPGVVCCCQKSADSQDAFTSMYVFYGASHFMG